jgi:hypothetical protein
MSPKSHIHKRCGTLRKKSFSARGYAEIHIQRLVFDNKKDSKLSIFGGISKLRLRADFGSFVQFWAEFAA